jgi:hypothetical protein
MTFRPDFRRVFGVVLSAVMVVIGLHPAGIEAADQEKGKRLDFATRSIPSGNEHIRIGNRIDEYWKYGE